MTDITVIWDETNGSADWAISQGELAVGNDLRSAVIVSLFTDARAPSDYQPSNGDPRGWWGDSYSPTAWGSRLWMLSRASKSGAANLLLEAQDFCNQALQWLIDDGVAASVTTTAFWITGTTLGITVSIKQPGSNSPTVFKFSWAWASISSAGN